MEKELSSETKTHIYNVKLYHPVLDGISCRNAGNSDKFQINATGEPQIRTQIESCVHGIFKGDRCNQCGTLAKVSYEKINDL